MAELLVVRGRAAFRALGRHGRRVREGPLTVIHHATGSSPRVAFAVGRKVGPAVARNRLRRRLRALWREGRHPAGDYLIVAAPAAVALPHAELRDRLQAALGRLETAA